MQHLPHNTQFGTEITNTKYNSFIYLYLHMQICTKLPVEKLLKSY